MEIQKRRSKAEWRDLIEQQAQSGLNGIRFCEQQGLSCKTFYRHRNALKEKAIDPVAGQFIRVQPKPASVLPLQPGVVLQYRDSRLQLVAGTDPLWVAQLMKALS